MVLVGNGDGFGWLVMVMVMVRMVRIVPALQAIDQEKRVCRRERSLTLTKTNLLENRRQVKIS